MSETATTVPSGLAQEEPSPEGALPRVRAGLDVDELRSKLDAAASRGRLPGLILDPRGSADLFHITDFGHPFEGVLIASQVNNGELAFATRVKPFGPALFAMVLALANTQPPSLPPSLPP